MRALLASAGNNMRVSNIREGEAGASQGRKEGCAEVASHDHVRSLAEIRDGLSKGSSAVEYYNPTALSGWNAEVSCFTGSSVFHSAEWANVLLSTYKWEACYVKAPNGILPLIEARSWARPARGVSLPFSDACEPLVRKDADFSDLLKIALKLGEQRKWAYLELRGISDNFGLQPSSQYWMHDLDLTGGPASVKEGLHPRARQAVDRARKLGVEVSLSADLEDLKAFWKLHQQTRRRHGVPPQPLDFMRKLHAHLFTKGMGLVSLARTSGRPIAGCVFLHFGTTAVYKLAASDYLFQHLRGGNAALWAGIQHYATNGFRSLNMGRTDMDNNGLRQFKLGWGARETLLKYSKFDFKTGSFVAEAARSGSSLATRIFRRMPESVLQIMGNVLYRHAA